MGIFKRPKAPKMPAPATDPAQKSSALMKTVSDTAATEYDQGFAAVGTPVGEGASVGLAVPNNRRRKRAGLNI